MTDQSVSVTVLHSLLLLLISSSLPPLVFSDAQICTLHDQRLLQTINKSFDTQWFDYRCDPTTKRVTQLSISQATISGGIPPAIGKLSSLESLNLFVVNNLTGPIPSFIGKLRNLKQFTIYSTNISGPIPAFLSRLRNLEGLHLSNNQLSGPLPAFLSDLPKLIWINLDNNRFSGSIPDSFGKFNDSLTVLDLSYNQLSGKIPESLGRFNFQMIYLSNNKLVGDASMLIKANETVEGGIRIDLSGNLLNFNLSKVSFHRNLMYLDLSRNRIWGTIPNQITELSFLDYFNVSYNLLCGKIPFGGRVQITGVFDHNQCLCGSPLPECK